MISVSDRDTPSCSVIGRCHNKQLKIAHNEVRVEPDGFVTLCPQGLCCVSMVSLCSHFALLQFVLILPLV